jgi:hypothetical protein
VESTLAALTAGGVPATADPDLVGQQVAAHGVVALILPPEIEGRALASQWDARVDVTVLGAPPGGLAQFKPIWNALTPAMAVLGVASALRATFVVGRLTYPGYLLSAQTGIEM